MRIGNSHGSGRTLLEVFELAAGATAFAVMFLAIVVQVCSRLFLQSQPVWTFELSIFAYIYVIYAGGVIAARKRTHIAFELLYNRLPRWFAAAADALAGLLLAGLFLWSIPASISYIRDMGAVRSSALDMPWGAVLAAYPAGMGLISLHLAAAALGRARDALRGGHESRTMRDMR